MLKIKRKSKKSLSFMTFLILPLSLMVGGNVFAFDVEALQELGHQVFFDNISDPAQSQSCASCHVPANGWTTSVSVADSKFGVVIPGANRAEQAAGGRKPQTVGYSGFLEPFHDAAPGGFISCTTGFLGVGCKGGAFWDGRARGTDVDLFPGMSNPAPHVGPEIFVGLSAGLAIAYTPFIGPGTDQATRPFQDEGELNVDKTDGELLGSAVNVCLHVQAAKYAPLYEQAWEVPIDCSFPGPATISLKRIALAIGAWEHSDDVNPFDSRRDAIVADPSDDIEFTAQEQLGQTLFYTRINLVDGVNEGGTGCVACHNSEGRAADGKQPLQLYTDQRYHHLGLPPNFDIRNFDEENPDLELARHTGQGDNHSGHSKTPTLRNVAKRHGNIEKAFMHHGYFKNLWQVVHFYNTASTLVDDVACPPGTTADEAVDRNCWPEAEVNTGRQAQNFGLFGNIQLTLEEELAIVAYLETLDDTSTPRKPKPFEQ